jgi:hypothetical protein
MKILFHRSIEEKKVFSDMQKHILGCIDHFRYIKIYINIKEKDLKKIKLFLEQQF